MMNLIQRNLPAKIIAVIAAIVLWFFVMNEQNPMIDGSFSVPLTIVNAPDGYKITSSVDVVKIKVRGPRAMFVTATAADFKAYVDLQGIEEGKQLVKIQSVLPQGFEFIETNPTTATFVIDKIIQKQMPAEITLGGTPAAGMTVDAISQSVKQVKIEGPSEAVNAVAKVSGYIALSGNSADFSASVPLMALNADGKEVPEVKIIPQTVDVSVLLARSPVKKVVPIKAIVASDLPVGYVLVGTKLDVLKVEITGDEKLLDGINGLETQPISLADINAVGTTKKAVKLKLPAGITVTNENIHVNIEIAEKK